MIRRPIDSSVEESPAYSTHFTRRLENFNDIVFGFALSFLATQLHVPERGAPLESFPIVGFLLTFAVIVTLWFTHYETFHYAFAARNVDVILSFGLLAGVALLPFLLQLALSRGATPTAFAMYAADLGIFGGISAILKLRGLKRFGNRLPAHRALHVFQAAIRLSILALTAAVTTASVTLFGRAGDLVLALAVLTVLVRRFVKTVPSRFLPEPAATPSR